jgi:hypothetical protein
MNIDEVQDKVKDKASGFGGNDGMRPVGRVTVFLPNS